MGCLSVNLPSTNNCYVNPFPVYNKDRSDKMLHIAKNYF